MVAKFRERRNARGPLLLVLRIYTYIHRLKAQISTTPTPMNFILADIVSTERERERERERETETERETEREQQQTTEA